MARWLQQLLFSLLLGVAGLGCDDDPLACTRTEQCESRCGTCRADCLPTGEQGAGECHCLCEKQATSSGALD